MSVSTTLLVVLMFTSIVGIGVANILMVFAGQVSMKRALAGRWLGAAWLLILLLTYLGMFWNSAILIRRNDWSYSLFLFVIFGPILLLFSSSLMARLLTENGGGTTIDGSDELLSRFFWIFAAVQGWLIGMDYVLGNNWTLSTTISAVLAGSAIVLGLTSNLAARWVFTVTMLALILSDIAAN